MSVLPTAMSHAIEDDGQTLAVFGPKDTVTRFSALWLRDNDPSDRDPGNGQKLTNITELALDARVTEVKVQNDGRVMVTFTPDGRRAVFDLTAILERRVPIPCRPNTWARDDFEDGPPTGSWSHIQRDENALRSWLTSVRDHGLAVLTNVPNKEDMVLQVVELFGHVRETNYGRLFDVRAEADPVNLAFTGLALSVHSDNPYRDPVPGIQLLHCLENDAEGGDTILVDGFNAAERLRIEAPDAFATLTRTWVTFRYNSANTELTARAPMISLDDRGQVTGIRFNNRSLAPLDLPADQIPGFYKAYRQFADILFDPASALTFKLSPGELFAVDNRRVLHGRTAFSATGKRHLRGCYADMDGLLSKLAVLERD